MKKLTIIVILITMLLLPNQIARAKTPQEMLGNLKDQLYQALQVKKLDSDTAVTTFVMALPGIPLDPDIDLTNPEDIRAIYKLLNFVPTGDITGQNQSDKMSDIYLRILDNSKNLVNNPKKPQLQAEADKLLKQWSDIYEYYFQYRQEYMTAQQAADIASAHNAPDKKQLQGKADLAKATWEVKGHKADYENLKNDWLKLLFKIEGGEPWGARRQKYSDAESQGFPVFTWPKYSSWAKENGWMKVTFGTSDLQTSGHHSTVQWSGGGSYGFFGFRAKAGGSTTIDTSQEELDKLAITFEVKRVLIDREWLDASVFRSKKWTWDDDANMETPISFGGFNKSKNIFEGRMPLLPTSLILIRKVKLESNWSKNVQEQIKKEMSASGGFGFGPFSIGGSYGNSSRDSSGRVQVTDAGIEIPDVQIIGWICDILPKSPYTP